MKRYFITGIGTDVGKTLVSAIITEALCADYWKPIQAGVDSSSGKTDTEIVQSLVGNEKSFFHKESFLLKMPASPHAAAKAEGLTVEMAEIKTPHTTNTLVIEGAGGLLVPLNHKELVADMITAFNSEVILVIKIYLGCINHTLLTCNELKRRNINVVGVVFNGERNIQTEEAIVDFTGLPVLAHIPVLSILSKQTVFEQASLLKNQSVFNQIITA